MTELLFTGNIPRGVSCEQRSQEIRGLQRQNGRLAHFVCILLL